MNRKNHLLFLLFLPLLLFSQDVSLQAFATGFTKPVDIKHAGDSRLFIVEQDGVIKIVNSAGIKNSTPFLNIDARVRSSGNKQGILSLAFDPNYAINHQSSKEIYIVPLISTNDAVSYHKLVKI